VLQEAVTSAAVLCLLRKPSALASHPVLPAVASCPPVQLRCLRPRSARLVAAPPALTCLVPFLVCCAQGL
jgi:hypothetical protein